MLKAEKLQSKGNMSESKSKKLPPSVNLSVRILRDPDFIELITSGDRGRAAFADFVALLILAKDRSNSGIWSEPIKVVANSLRISARSLRDSIQIITRICRLNGTTPWISIESDCITIRNFELYNSWGGKRAGAGRPNEQANLDFKSNSSGNQDASTPKGIGIGSSSSLKFSLDEDDELIQSGNPNGPVTSSERHILGPRSMQAYAKLPDHHQASKSKFGAAFIQAVRRGASSNQLESALVEYYASPVGMGGYAISAIRFLDDDCYEANRAAWQKTSGDKPLGSGKTLADVISEADRKENHG